jgi:hypothetical protein
MMVATSRRAPRHVDADGRQRRADPGVTPALGTSPLGDGFQKRRLLSEAWATFCGEVGRTWYRGRAENRGFPSSSGEGGLIGPPRSARDGLDRAALFHRLQRRRQPRHRQAVLYLFRSQVPERPRLVPATPIVRT